MFPFVEAPCGPWAGCSGFGLAEGVPSEGTKTPFERAPFGPARQRSYAGQERTNDRHGYACYLFWGVCVKASLDCTGLSAVLCLRPRLSSPSPGSAGQPDLQCDLVDV